jgi:hypothetical protein
MLEYAQAIILPFSMVAALIGIYFVEKKPYTHIAAVAVVVATIIGLVDAVKTVREKHYAEEMLRHLARSSPPSPYWKDEVRKMITEIGRPSGYALVRAYYTRTDYDDPEAATVFVFRSTNLTYSGVKGLLVLTPSDYVELASLGKQKVRARLREWMFGRWEKHPTKDDGSTEEFMERLGQTAAALYTLPNLKKGFNVSVRRSDDGKSITIQTGEAELSFPPGYLGQLLTLPPLERTVRVAQMIAKTEPRLNKYLNISD